MTGRRRTASVLAGVAVGGALTGGGLALTATDPTLPAACVVFEDGSAVCPPDTMAAGATEGSWTFANSYGVQTSGYVPGTAAP